MKISWLKFIVSTFVILFCFTALHDILVGQKNTAIECIVLFFGVIWFIYLIHPFRPPKFLLAFFVFLISVVLHNVISFFIKTEEPVFFFLSLIALFLSFIWVVSSIVQKLRKLLFKK